MALVCYGQNYNGVPIPNPDTRPDLAKPVIYWVPVIAPGNLMFYRGTQTFPQWNGNGFISGLATKSLNRIIFDDHGGAKTAERWDVVHRVRDVEEGPDGSLWMLEDAKTDEAIRWTQREHYFGSRYPHYSVTYSLGNGELKQFLGLAEILRLHLPN